MFFGFKVSFESLLGCESVVKLGTLFALTLSVIFGLRFVWLLHIIRCLLRWHLLKHLNLVSNLLFFIIMFFFFIFIRKLRFEFLSLLSSINNSMFLFTLVSLCLNLAWNLFSVLNLILFSFFYV